MTDPRRTAAVGSGVVARDCAGSPPGHRGDRRRQISPREEVEVEIVEPRRGDGCQIEGQVAGSALVAEDPLIGCAGDGSPRTDPDGDASFETERSVGGWLNRHDGQRAAIDDPFLDRHRRKGKDVAVRAHVRELLEEAVGHLQAGTVAVVLGADDDDAGLAVVGQVVGEGADRFADPVRIRERSFAFAAIRFEILQQFPQLIVGHGRLQG